MWIQRGFETTTIAKTILRSASFLMPIENQAHAHYLATYQCLDLPASHSVLHLMLNAHTQKNLQEMNGIINCIKFQVALLVETMPPKAGNNGIQ